MIFYSIPGHTGQADRSRNAAAVQESSAHSRAHVNERRARSSDRVASRDREKAMVRVGIRDRSR